MDIFIVLALGILGSTFIFPVSYYIVGVNATYDDKKKKISDMLNIAWLISSLAVVILFSVSEMLDGKKIGTNEFFYIGFVSGCIVCIVSVSLYSCTADGKALFLLAKAAKLSERLAKIRPSEDEITDHPERYDDSQLHEIHILERRIDSLHSMALDRRLKDIEEELNRAYAKK